MVHYFGVNFTFGEEHVLRGIHQGIESNKPGYVCVVDANVLTMAQKDESYREILNDSLLNTCDGSSIATIAGWIYGRSLYAYNGPTLFEELIPKPYKQLLLGSNEETVQTIKEKLRGEGRPTEHLEVMTLPFKNVEEFDYESIAERVNSISPDLIWVSLGAPKQEVFMYNLEPFLNRGIMFGIGAAFNFYVGKINLPTFQIGNLRFIWLSRIFAEPKKMGSRLSGYLFALPKMILRELFIKHAKSP